MKNQNWPFHENEKGQSDESFGQKIRRYLYYYRIPLIIGISLAAVILFLIVSIRDVPDYDFYVLYVTRNTSEFSSESGSFLQQKDRIEELLIPYLEDLNEDGDIRISVEIIVLDRIAEADLSTEDKENLYAEADRFRIKKAIEGNVYLIIADTEGAEYTVSLGLSENIRYLIPDSDFSGYAYELNQSEKGREVLGLEANGEKCYVLMKKYYDTYRMLKEKETNWAEMAEKIIMCLSDLDFDPSYDETPAHPGT